MTENFEAGDLVADLTMDNKLGVVQKKTDKLVYVLHLIDRKDAKDPEETAGVYHPEEITKEFLPKQKDIFEAMFGSPVHVPLILSMDPKLNPKELPTADYIFKWLDENCYMDYCRSYFQFLYNLNPIPLNLGEHNL